jgi:hypothetical protein
VRYYENHPIFANVGYLASWAPTSSSQVQGDGQPLGYLESGALLGAWNAAKPVVALNFYPATGAWSGDLIPMMGNVFDWLAKSGFWLSAQPRNLRVAPGATAQATVSFDGSKASAGPHSGWVVLSHNIAGTEAVVVPAAMDVAGTLGMEVTAKAIDFGEVLVGLTGEMPVAVRNTGNLPITVTDVFTGNPAYYADPDPFPAVLQPGQKALVYVWFAPTSHSSAPATLTFNVAEGLAPVSVSLTGTGMRLADLSVATKPDPLKFNVPLGGQTTGSVLVSNLGDESMGYWMVASFIPDATQAAAAKARPVYGPEHYVPLAKGALDTRVGQPVDQSLGGPDAFGYRWMDSRQTDGPVFKWIDISATGRKLETVSACDDCTEYVNLSFEFPFYGQSTFALSVSSNGFLTMGIPDDRFSNYPLPSQQMPQALVAALFQDLYPPAGGSIWFQDFGDKAVVQYQAVRDFQGTGSYDFEIILYADGAIDLQYLRLTGVKNTCTVGIQNYATDDGLQVVYNAPYLRNNLAVRLRTWLGTPYLGGRILGQGTDTKALRVDSRGLPPGTYKASLSVTGGGSMSEKTLTFPVELNVGPTRAKP